MRPDLPTGSRGISDRWRPGRASARATLARPPSLATPVSPPRRVNPPPRQPLANPPRTRRTLSRTGRGRPIADRLSAVTLERWRPRIDAARPGRRASRGVGKRAPRTIAPPPAAAVSHRWRRGYRFRRIRFSRPYRAGGYPSAATPPKSVFFFLFFVFSDTRNYSRLWRRKRRARCSVHVYSGETVSPVGVLFASR